MHMPMPAKADQGGINGDANAESQRKRMEEVLAGDFDAGTQITFGRPGAGVKRYFPGPNMPCLAAIEPFSAFSNEWKIEQTPWRRHRIISYIPKT